MSKTISRAAIIAFATISASHVVHAQKKIEIIVPTLETVRTGFDVVTGAPTLRQIWIENNSTIPIRVLQVVLRGCQNLSNGCGEFKSKAKVEPGQRVTLLTLRQQVRGNPVSIGGYGVRWMMDSTSAVFLRYMLESGVQGARKQGELLQRGADTSASGNAAFDARDAELSPDDIARLGDKIATWRAEPDSVVLRIGEGMLLDGVRVLAIDAEGKALGRLRAYKVSLSSAGVRIAPPDTIAPTASGRHVLIISPSDGLNAARSKPLGDLRLTIIVP